MSDILDAIKKTEEAILDGLEMILGPKKEKEAPEEARGTQSAREKEHYSIDTENLAVPETHTGKANFSDKEDMIESGEKSEKPEIHYDTVAVPEIHFKKQ